MNNACPECGAIYAVAEKDIGRRIACKRCSTPLIVAEDGLRREEVEEIKASVEKAGDDNEDRKRDRDEDDQRDSVRSRGRVRNDDDDRSTPRRSGRGGRGVTQLVSQLKFAGDLATWLYGIGLFFVVYSFFSPRIDESKVSVRQGYLDQLKQEGAIQDRKDKLKNNGELSENRKKELKEFKEKTLDPAEDAVGFARSGKMQSEWWNILFQMFGFILISFGSLGFLSARQPWLQRVVGGVTLLLVLLQVIGGGAVLHVGLGGGPPPRIITPG